MLADYLAELAEETAPILAGRAVVINWTGPRDGRYGKGMAGRLGDVAIVDLAPSLPPGEFLAVYLHELAHIRRHWATIPDEAEASLEARPKGRLFPNPWARLAYERREKEAEAQARQWSTWLAGQLPGGRGSLEAALVTLGKWRPTT